MGWLMHKMNNLRDIVEGKLLQNFSNFVRPLTPKDEETIRRYQDGSFPLSLLGFALYSNGHNLRGNSSFHPCGLIYEDGETLFSIGYFRAELDPVDSDGYLFAVAPRGKDVTKKVKSFADRVLSDDSIPCRGVYVRFLNLEQYFGLLNNGFLPIEEHPWHPDSPKEDETVNSALLSLEDIFEGEKIKSEKLAYATRRFKRFSEENNLVYTLKIYDGSKFGDALKVIQQHFETLIKNGNQIGSTTEDHLNSLSYELTNRKGVAAYVGYLGDEPVSIFVGEDISEGRLALYTPFTLRSPEQLLPRLNIQANNKSTMSIKNFLPRYAYTELFRKLACSGVREIHMGGSEHKNLNRFKREMGCKNFPSYWAVKLKSE